MRPRSASSRRSWARSTAAESAELAATRLRVRAAVERGVAALDTARAEADAYAGAILALDALAAEAALAGYKTGQVPFVSVLDAQSTLYRDRMEQAELLGRVLRQSAVLLAYGADE